MKSAQRYRLHSLSSAGVINVITVAPQEYFSCATTMDYLRSTVFAEKFDPREERFPDYFLDLWQLGKLGVAGVHPMYWTQLQTIVLMQTLLNVVVAIIIFKFIVQRRGSALSYSIGYGIVCPTLVCVPVWIISLADLYNPAFLVASAASPVLLFFRCLEAMHGTVPAFAEKSLSTFLLYYCATVQFEIDPNTGHVIRIDTKYLISQTLKFLILFAEISVVFSILIPLDYQVFSQKEITSLTDLFYWGNLGNNYVMAFLTALMIEVGATGVGLLTSLLSGIKTVQLNFNPLTASSSPSDFWGRRWNRLVSSGLKRGIFRPFRKNGYGRNTAALATFLVSGLLHEYILVIIAIRKVIQMNQISLRGTHFLFFFWNGIVLLAEPPLTETPFVQWVSRNFPRPVKTFLVVLTVLPVAHLFTNEYKEVYDAFSLGFPRFYIL